MRNFLLFLIIALSASTVAQAENQAPGTYLPPLPLKNLHQSLEEPLSQHDIARYLLFQAKTTIIAAYAGQNELLKDREPMDYKILEVAAGFEVEYNESDLFGPPLAENGRFIYRAVISSMDAQALRLQVDLAGLREEDDVYVIDPVLPRAFGPYAAADALEEGRWLATTEGDWALLVVSTPHNTPPALRLTNVAHFYRGFGDFLKQLSCNINIACEDNPAVLDVASGVGLLVVPQLGGSQGLCTCTLVNNADTPELEPYVLTSNHCVPDVAPASQVDVVWDYRATACDTNDPPALSSLPRSDGTRMLTTNSELDITLMEVSSVPNGAFGRFYAGWTDRAVFAGEAITGIHHPRTSHMRISYGDILTSDVTGVLYYNQIEVLWSDGVTEPGSSGLGLLLDSAGYKIIGTLSNGREHICGSLNNTDQFSSFRLFFPQARGFLTGTDKPDPQDDGACPAEVAFKSQPEVLEQLREFRDSVLMKTPVGRKLVDAYYSMAPALAKRVQESPQTAAVFRTLALTVAGSRN